MLDLHDDFVDQLTLLPVDEITYSIRVAILYECQVAQVMSNVRE